MKEAERTKPVYITWKILNASMAVKSCGLFTSLVLIWNSSFDAKTSKLLAISISFKGTLNFSSDGGLLIKHQFPFHDLTDIELSRTTGSWIYGSSDRLKGKLNMYKDILESSDKNDPLKYLQETHFESKYSLLRNLVSFSKIP